MARVVRTLRVDARPSFQFYPTDWLCEAGLRICSLAARGLWIDLLCSLWSMPERGLLRSKGQPLTKQAIVSLVGRPEAEVDAALKELLADLGGHGPNVIVRDNPGCLGVAS